MLVLGICYVNGIMYFNPTGAGMFSLHHVTVKLIAVLKYFKNDVSTFYEF